MTGELVARFLIGGALVSLFALVGDVLEPKTFAGLFGAAPSVALATLALTIHAHGGAYGAREARSMALGALALLVCAAAISAALHRWRTPVGRTVFASLLVWVAVAAAGGALLLRVG